MTALIADEMLLLEQATLKIPLDEFKRYQKMTQKTWEHNLGYNTVLRQELRSLLASPSTAASSSSTTAIPSTATSNRIDSALKKMRGLKRKLMELHANSIESVEMMTARVNHLDAIPSTMLHPDYDDWSNKRLSLHLTDYFLRSNPPLKDSAQILAQDEEISALVDHHIWAQLGKIEDGLRGNNVNEALKWSGENRSALKKVKSPLEFTLHLQAFIELCRRQSHTQAIEYAKKNLSPSALADRNESGMQLMELTRATGLLAFGPDTTCRIYKDLYSPTRWTSLIALFRSTFLTLHSLPTIPLLHLSLQAGLASLKTPICCPLPPSAASTSNKSLIKHPVIEESPSANCPLCSSDLKVLAQEVPYSHHLNTTIVCKLSGKVVEGGGEDGGELLAIVDQQLGDGRVYSKAALLKQAASNPEGTVTDPKTGRIYAWDELKKVYVI